MTKLLSIANRLNDPDAPGATAGGLDNTLATCAGIDQPMRMGWSGQTIPDNRYDFEHPENHMSIVDRTVKGRSMTFMFLDLPEEAQRGHYERASNGVKWPASHFRPDLVQFDQSYMDDYNLANVIYARATKAVVQPDWILNTHDYQLDEFGEELLKLGVFNPNGMMFHIPYYDQNLLEHPAMAEAAPFLRRATERSMFAYDFIALQAPRDILNFQSVLATDQPPLNLNPYETGFLTNRFGERAYVGVCPATCDADHMRELSDASVSDPRLGQFIKDATKGRTNTKVDMVGFDRLDYTKALPRRLDALRHCITTLGADPDDIHLIQATPASREAVSGYKQEQSAYTSRYRQLRREFGNVVFTPHNPDTNRAIAVPPYVVAGLYRQARVGVFLSDIDGQHLGPAEMFGSMNMKNPGVALMSDTIGAAVPFRNAAVIVKPTVEDMARGMMLARTMPFDERLALALEGRRVNQVNTNARWLKALVDETERGARMRTKASVSSAMPANPSSP